MAFKKNLKKPTFVWKPFSAKQIAVIESVHNRPARLNILDGAVRSGKTISSLVTWATYVTQVAPPSVPLLMTGRTERTLYRNCIEPMITMFGEANCKYRQAQGELIFYGRLIYLAGANDERAENKIRGMTVGGAYCDEITLHPRSFFQMLLTRMSVEGARLYGTTNPDGPNHWLKAEYLDRANELDLVRWIFRLEDNLALPKSYVDNLKREFSGLFYKRFIEGAWVMAEGAIYDMLNPQRHYTQHMPTKIIDAYVALDYGTTNPLHAVYLIVALDDSDPRRPIPRLYVADELVYDSKRAGRQKTDAEYSVMLREWLSRLPVSPTRVIVDPSAASFIVQLHKDGIRGVSKANNEVLDGIRSTSTLISNDRLIFVEPNTRLTRDDMLGYVWDSKAGEKGEDKPIKLKDHGADALRYGVMGTSTIWRGWISATVQEKARQREERRLKTASAY